MSKGREPSRRKPVDLHCYICHTDFNRELFPDQIEEPAECPGCNVEHQLGECDDCFKRCHQHGCKRELPAHFIKCRKRDCEAKDHPDEVQEADYEVYYINLGPARRLDSEIRLEGQPVDVAKLAEKLELEARHKHLAGPIWSLLLEMSGGANCRDCGKDLRSYLGPYHFLCSNLAYKKKKSYKRRLEESVKRRENIREHKLDKLARRVRDEAEKSAPAPAVPPIEKPSEPEAEEKKPAKAKSEKATKAASKKQPAEENAGKS